MKIYIRGFRCYRLKGLKSIKENEGLPRGHIALNPWPGLWLLYPPCNLGYYYHDILH
jgi:hypothetical protein